MVTTTHINADPGDGGREHSRSGSGMSSARLFGSGLALSLVLWTAPGSAAELRPAVSVGGADIVGGHIALGAALRVQIASALFVQAEYLALRGDAHTDQGPTLQVGLSGRNRNGFRPFIGLGGGPVKGYGGDDGLRYVAVGAAHPLGRRGRAFLQAELRAGLLGESAYRQFAVSLGVSK